MTLNARLFRFKAYACSKIILIGYFPFRSRYHVPTWFKRLFSFKLLPHQTQILSLLDDTNSFLLLPLLYTFGNEKTKKSIINPKMLEVVMVQEMKAAVNQK